MIDFGCRRMDFTVYTCWNMEEVFINKTYAQGWYKTFNFVTIEKVTRLNVNRFSYDEG